MTIFSRFWLLTLPFASFFSHGICQEHPQGTKARTPSKGSNFIELRTTITPARIRSSCEESGLIQFVVDPDHFPDTSAENPIYLRIELDKEAVLGTTLVWSHPSNINALTYQPIYLPISIDGGGNSGTNPMIAPPESVSIVRWKKGESAFWIKIQSPSSAWVDLPDPPRVRWTVGISAKKSWEQSNQGPHSNLKGTSRNLNILSENDAVSTLFCVDLRASILLPAPLPDRFSLLDFIPQFFVDTTQNVETADTQGDIIFGTEIPNAFYEDTSIIRGYIYECEASVTDTPSQLSTSLCPLPAKAGSLGLVQLTSDIREFVADCSNWGVNTGSYLQFIVPEQAEYGFRVLLDNDGYPIASEEDPSKVLLDPESIEFISEPAGLVHGSSDTLFQLPSGEFLCRDAELAFTGVNTAPNFRLSFKASIWGVVGAPTQAIVLKQAFYPSSRDTNDIQDLPPFDGPDQHRRCDSSLIEVPLPDWSFGEFLACDICDCPLDFDCDYVLDTRDLLLLLNQLLISPSSGDLNGDGKADILDALYLINSFGSCLND